jgi:HSP20 family molecular chaperone IbpA
MKVQTWQPAADVFSKGDRWFVKLEIAGVQVDDICISACSDRLIITGVRRDILLKECVSYHSLEIAYSRFERSIMVPFNIDSSSIDWEYTDGMLLIRLGTVGER